MIGIIDYGMGNLASVADALEKLGADAKLVRDALELQGCERAILPGVGSFSMAMSNLETRGWTPAIKSYVESGKPLLGICLGMQLLFTRGTEHGDTQGLDLIKGRVELMNPPPPARIPHVGWNSLSLVRRHPLFEGVALQADMYFVHSYECVPEREEDVLARCEHGRDFVASVGRENVVGMQFHPEKSQPMGLRFLENFASWDGTC